MATSCSLRKTISFLSERKSHCKLAVIELRS